MKRWCALCVLSVSFACAGGWQVQETSQWLVRYKGAGALAVMEGKRADRSTLYDSSGHFKQYGYKIEDATNNSWGVAGVLPVVILVQNSDAKSILKVTPKPGITAFTQPIQIVGSNANFKQVIIKAPRDAEQSVFGLMSGGAILIDGHVSKLTTNARLLASFLIIGSCGSMACRSMYYSYLVLGTPQQYVSNAYVDYYGETNDYTTMNGGDLDTLKVAGSIQDSMVFAGCMPLASIFTVNLPTFYNSYPPGGTIGKVQATALSGVGRFNVPAAKWLATCHLIGDKRPEIKIPTARILTEGSSVYINE
jgi:hypothetical protein